MLLDWFMAGRNKTSYKGVYWREVKRKDGQGYERMYYIVYRRGGRGTKLIEEPVGRASQGWTEKRANDERALRSNDRKPCNKEKREQARQETKEQMTVGRLWQLYYESHAGNRTIRNDRNRYNRHVCSSLAQVAIGDLSTSHIEKLRRNLESYGLSPQSVKHCLALVRRIVNYGKKAGLFTLRQPLYFAMPKVDNIKTENMTYEQLQAYWQALAEEPDQNLANLLRLVLVTGIRKSAAMSLRWQDCDFENRQITLAGQYAKNGKTDYIPMIQAAYDLLKSQAQISEWVFADVDGNRLKNVYKGARRVRENAGLPKDFRPFHGLRHVFASHMASEGVSLIALQQLMTHSSAVPTQRYIHYANQALQQAASAANSLAGKNDSQED